MMHDFQLTPNYAVLLDLPVVFDLSTTDSGFPFVWSPQSGARIGLLSRSTPSEPPQWFDIDVGFMFHTFNAYEDSEGRVVLEGCRVPSLWADSVADATQTPTPWRWTLNPKTGTSREGAFEDLGVDFPMIDPRKQGQNHRINYGLLLRGGNEDYPTHPMGLVKHHRDRDTTEVWSYQDDFQPDEALFIPHGREEDSGYLMSMVYNRGSERSEVHLFDASALTDGPIATIQMPGRVPFGFHGCWVPNPEAS